jgi:hypothetical protein
MTDTGEVEAGERARRIAMYVLAAPIVLVMGSALVKDPGRIGTESSATGMPVFAFVAIAAAMSGLMVAVWVCSEFAFRTPVLALQLVVVWLGGLLYQQGLRVDVTVWDVVEDAVLLGTTLLQLVPGRAGRPTSVWRT